MHPGPDIKGTSYRDQLNAGQELTLEITLSQYHLEYSCAKALISPPN